MWFTTFLLPFLTVPCRTAQSPGLVKEKEVKTKKRSKGALAAQCVECTSETLEMSWDRNPLFNAGVQLGEDTKTSVAHMMGCVLFLLPDGIVFCGEGV